MLRLGRRGLAGMTDCPTLNLCIMAASLSGAINPLAFWRDLDCINSDPDQSSRIPIADQSSAVGYIYKGAVFAIQLSLV